MKRFLIVVVSLLASAVAHAQMRATYVPAPSSEQQRRLRELDAKLAARREHADAALEQQRITREGAQASECAQSFPARLADARQAIVAASKATDEWKRIGAAAKWEWFGEHCRFLSELENAIRKNDDPNAFVCDTTKGRPKGLTSKFLMTYPQDPPAVTDYEERAADDQTCAEYDTAERVALVFASPASSGQRLEVLCFNDDRPACVDARAQFEAAKAKKADESEEP
jgi:hypothetical protein